MYKCKFIWVTSRNDFKNLLQSIPLSVSSYSSESHTSNCLLKLSILCQLRTFLSHLFSSSFLSSARIIMLDIHISCFSFLIDIARDIIDIIDILWHDLFGGKSFVPTYKMEWSGLLFTDGFTWPLCMLFLHLKSF